MISSEELNMKPKIVSPKDKRYMKSRPNELYPGVREELAKVLPKLKVGQQVQLDGFKSEVASHNIRTWVYLNFPKQFRTTYQNGTLGITRYQKGEYTPYRKQRRSA